VIGGLTRLKVTQLEVCVKNRGVGGGGKEQGKRRDVPMHVISSVLSWREQKTVISWWWYYA